MFSPSTKQGCDALNTTLVAILTGSALNLHQSWIFVSAHLAALANFYLSTWEEYHTGTLYLSYCNGPVEGIIMIVCLFVYCGIYGTSLFDETVASAFPQVAKVVPGLLAKAQLKEILVWSTWVFVAFNIVTGARNVVRAHRAKKDGLIKPFMGLVPFLVFVGGVCHWLHESPTILHHHLVAFVMLTGCLFGDQVGKMIVAHVCHRPFPHFNLPVYLTMLIGMASATWFRAWDESSKSGAREGEQAVGLHAAAELVKTFQPKLVDLLHSLGIHGTAQRIRSCGPTEFVEGVVVYILLVSSVVVYFRFALKVINALCEVFDINCLTIKHKVTGKTDGPVEPIEKVKVKKEL
ncbi:hypothetical protein HK104_003051 [Borealophlyctis nickersoniae]|nr:hypothetical protein HK104_003051 [Borealophlyctis nickersoniae]